MGVGLGSGVPVADNCVGDAVAAIGLVAVIVGCCGAGATVFVVGASPRHPTSAAHKLTNTNPSVTHRLLRFRSSFMP